MNKSQQRNPRKQTAQQSKRAPRRRNRRRGPSKTIGVHMSPCAAKYIGCLANPFTGPLACVPSQFPNRTSRQRVFVRGSMTIAASPDSFGFIMVDPRRSAFNDSPCLIASKSAFTAQQWNGNSPSVDTYNSNAQYPKSALTDGQAGINYRIVGSGLRARYTGTNLNMGGTYHCLHDPTHSTIQSRNIGSAESEIQAVRVPINKKWVTVLYYPISEGEYTLLDDPFVASSEPGTLTTTTSHWYMGILIAAPEAGSYDFEFFSVVEYQGATVRGQQPSEADPNAVAIAVTAAVNHGPSQATPEETHQSFLSLAAHYAREGLTYASDGVQLLKDGKNLLTGANEARKFFSGDTKVVGRLAQQTAELLPMLM
jgi:hypothetical protein